MEASTSTSSRSHVPVCGTSQSLLLVHWSRATLSSASHFRFNVAAVTTVTTQRRRWLAEPRLRQSPAGLRVAMTSSPVKAEWSCGHYRHGAARTVHT